MAWTFTEGTETVGTTEHDLMTDATYSSGTLQSSNVSAQLWLETNNIARGDVFEVRVYEKVIGSSTVRSFILDPALPIGDVWVSPALLLGNGWTFTLKKLSGTDRAFNWSVRQIPEA